MRTLFLIFLLAAALPGCVTTAVTVRPPAASGQRWEVETRVFWGNQ